MKINQIVYIINLRQKGEFRRANPKVVNEILKEKLSAG